VRIRPCRLQLVMPQKDGKSVSFLYEATKLMGNNGPYEVSTGCPITAVIRSRRSSKAVSECCTQTSVGQIDCGVQLGPCNVLGHTKKNSFPNEFGVHI